jgi:hypothetical protein
MVPKQSRELDRMQEVVMDTTSYGKNTSEMYNNP